VVGHFYTLACENGQMQMVQKLIDQGANLNEKKARVIGDYKIPLRIACELGHLAVVKLLVENGANATEAIIF